MVLTEVVMKIYKSQIPTTPGLLPFRGKILSDVGMFYAPYVPLSPHTGRFNDFNEIMESRQCGFHTFMFTNGAIGKEVYEWGVDNLGRQHKGVWLAGLGIWIGNWGNWKFDVVGGDCPRVWLRRSEDIMLFKLRWME